MGDRTHYTLTLPDELDVAAVRAAAEAFLDEPVTAEEARGMLDMAREQDRDVEVTIDERRCGEAKEAVQDVRDALTGHGVDVAFACFEDPKYEWLGTLVRHQPGKALHVVDCDSEGHAVLTDAALASIEAKVGGDPAVVLRAIKDHLGTNWVED